MASAFLDSDSRLESRQKTITQAYTVCENITRSASTSFMRSFRYLDEERRKSVFALYAFCRRADDIVDGDWQPDVDLSHLDERAENTALQMIVDRQCESHQSDDFVRRVRALLWFHENLNLIENGKEVYSPIFIALQDTIEKFSVRIDDLRTLLEGMADDLFPTEYRTFEEMRSYCFKVASTVGLSLIEIYGYTDPNAREHAEEMGIFLQMVNVLRDIDEDLARGRVYLPMDELSRFDIDIKELSDPALARTTRWQNFMRHYVHRAKTHRDNAMRLLPLLDRKARKSPEMMCIVYGEILNEVERREGDVLSSRIKLGFMRKIRFALSALGIWSITA
tara:strand:- start:246 stop:1253 length:1008 start_codon:yes stop_codon:yes gene_type:complete